jgi:hypothetical protein
VCYFSEKCQQSLPVPVRRWQRKGGWDREAVARLPSDARAYYEDVKQWEGVNVTCGRVSHLLLSGNRLRGSLPQALWSMAHLVELNLSGNELAGGLAPQISQLTSLTWLDLSANGLGGKIPRAIGGCAVWTHREGHIWTRAPCGTSGARDSFLLRDFRCDFHGSCLERVEQEC